jgi:hypothetical protein
MQHKPQWLLLSDELLWPLIGMGLSTLHDAHIDDRDTFSWTHAALLHFAHCLEISMEANLKGRHSVAICLVRHCVESLTLVDIGLQDPAFRKPLLVAWEQGRKGHGELRAALEKAVWPAYGAGLWDETWAEYFGNLSKAVQPYAHYTQQLQGWQYSVLATMTDGYFATLDPFNSYDPLKATRITLLHALSGWTLGRLLLAHGKHTDVLQRREKIAALGTALAGSKLLWKRKDWGLELRPDLIFKPGHDWIDP